MTERDAMDVLATCIIQQAKARNLNLNAIRFACTLENGKSFKILFDPNIQKLDIIKITSEECAKELAEIICKNLGG